mmetsp:Transcript_13141/g.9528  ORF Transcript_13141/g.9528 Transcript_13141/m.9528 type:complete len:87 (+) Transcript_13141:1404-1664(+)
MGEVIYFLLDTKHEKKSTIIDCIPAHPQSKKNRFVWMRRMYASVEGTDKGILTINDLEQHDYNKGGRCLFQLHTDFMEKVTCIHYN